MRFPRRTLGFAAAAVAATTVMVAPPAQATTHVGERSLASLLPPGKGFDKNPGDFDIVTAAVYAVLAAKPDSPVGLLADGSVALTAFLPYDYAFTRLVTDLTGSKPTSEQATFDAVAGLGIDTVETVLLYHVVPGKTIYAWQARRSNGATLTTAAGLPLTVKTRGRFDVQFIDGDPNDANAWLVWYDINAGNKQIAHGISQVLRPIDL